MKEKWTKHMLNNMSSHREWHDVSNLIRINLITTDANDEVDGACSMKKKQQKQK